MNFLLDTHILLWAIADDEQLPEKAKELIENEKNEIYFSVISLWEIQIKHILYPEQLPNAKTVAEYCKKSGFKMISLEDESIYRLEKLTRPDSAPRYKDPFDKILICQAITKNMIFLTHDSLISEYNVPNIMFV
ncbi:MAG: type II toxin-antitoxin system VapC family toxin [Oscillospiraceae bacterium]|nr:type II toxin-antitoxin system VapC family toxin [Oscillospiraceae bacterium]